MEKKYPRSIGKRTALLVVALCMALAAISGIISYTNYARSMDEHYKTLATNLAETAAIMMDGDKIAGYMDTMVADDDYNEMLDTLFTIKENNDIAYIYIQTMRNDKSYYIMDADHSDTGGVLGEEDPVPPEFIPVLKTIMEEGTEPTITDTEDYGWLCSVYAPIRDASGKGVAIVGVDISMNEVMEVRQGFLLLLVATMAVSTIFIGVVATIAIRRAIIRPIGQIAKYTNDFIQQEAGQGGLQIADIGIKSQDELQMLADSVHTMQVDINNYIENLSAITAEKERIGAELDVAKHIQASMLPCIFPAFPGRPELDIYATMTPAKEVGGDFYDFFLVDDDHLAMVMADVSGKGVPAALFMVIAKTLLKNVTQSGLSAADVLSKVNDQLSENNEAEMFVTVWLGILEISTGIMTCANAGHEYPVIRRDGGAYELIKDKHGPVLAAIEGMKYKQYTMELHPGDRLYLYTDGVAEATDADNQLYGTNRMVEALNNLSDASCEELLHGVQVDIDRFVGAAPQFDDITMLAMELKKL